MKQKILIVEDEPAIADNIKYALETEGFDTIYHAEGKNILPLLSRDRIDLIVLDIGLPDINGLELCKEIRKTHSVPVIFLTARADEIDRVVGLEIGADDYMVKPFSPRELTARIKAVLRRTVNTNHTVSEVESTGPFEVDDDRCRVIYFNEVLDLSPYEYRLLTIFIKRPGYIFSRDRLMDMVWEEPDMSMDRTVDAHIKNLRNKLKKIKPDVDPIQTHRGLGYALKEDL